MQCGPRGLPGESDFLFRNDGDVRFTDVSAKAGVADPDGYFGLGVAWFDFNDDGWPDLYVANDSDAELPLLESEGRHVQGGRVSDGRGGQRGRRRAGQHGRGRRRLRQQRPIQPAGSRTSPRSTTRSIATRAITSRTCRSGRRPPPSACRSSAGATRSSTTTTTVCSTSSP